MLYSSMYELQRTSKLDMGPVSLPPLCNFLSHLKQMAVMEIESRRVVQS